MCGPLFLSLLAAIPVGSGHFRLLHLKLEEKKKRERNETDRLVCIMADLNPCPFSISLILAS